MFCYICLYSYLRSYSFASKRRQFDKIRTCSTFICMSVCCHCKDSQSQELQTAHLPASCYMCVCMCVCGHVCVYEATGNHPLSEPKKIISADPAHSFNIQSNCLICFIIQSNHNSADPIRIKPPYLLPI